MTTNTITQIETALRRAYSLGQTYWQQADSEYTSQHKKADITAEKFMRLIAETEAAIAQTASHNLQKRLADLHLYEEIAEHYAKCAASPEALRDWVAERINSKPAAPKGKTMTDKMRESFEAWFTSKRGYGMLSKLPPNTGGYEWVATSESWEVWQAATEAERERCAKVCESLHYTDTSTAQNCADAIRQGGDA